MASPGFYALNTAVQHSFPIYDELHLLFRVEALNIFKHPNYGNIDNYLPDSTFGTSNGVANQLYASGASRSLQLSLKLQF